MNIPSVFSGLRILVVEDEPDNREVTRRCLYRAGADVIPVTNGYEALETLQTRPVDLIITDLSMPRMDGFKLLNLIRADYRTSHIPVIALTAHAMQGDREQALAVGFCDYITKPVSPMQLIEQVAHTLCRDMV